MFNVRSINRNSESEVRLVASRMQLTLMEVLGQERGKEMYTIDWLIDRVLFHLDPEQCDGEVFIAETENSSAIIGHTIVRVDQENGSPIGLFSTFYVVSEFRKNSVASVLMDRGETWMRERGLQLAATDTSLKNHKLIRLCTKHGYKKSFENSEMLRLSKILN